MSNPQYLYFKNEGSYARAEYYEPPDPTAFLKEHGRAPKAEIYRPSFDSWERWDFGKLLDWGMVNEDEVLEYIEANSPQPSS